MNRSGPKIEHCATPIEMDAGSELTFLKQVTCDLLERNDLNQIQALSSAPCNSTQFSKKDIVVDGVECLC
jgi:hypothetical protein